SPSPGSVSSPVRARPPGILTWWRLKGTHMETKDIVVMEVDCERCDGVGCEYCYGQPEEVRVRDGHRLCEHVRIVTDMDGGWLDIECLTNASDRLEFSCDYEGMPGPQKCVIHVCREHRLMALQDLVSEDTELVEERHRPGGFPVLGRAVPPRGEMLGCPMCAVEAGMDNVQAWEATWGTRRDDLPKRAVV